MASGSSPVPFFWRGLIPLTTMLPSNLRGQGQKSIAREPLHDALASADPCAPRVRGRRPPFSALRASLRGMTSSFAPRSSWIATSDTFARRDARVNRERRARDSDVHRPCFVARLSSKRIAVVVGPSKARVNASADVLASSLLACREQSCGHGHAA
jgi:hypothetical protein